MLDEAIDRVSIGLAKKSRVVGERQRRTTAYHEAGHALVAHLLPDLDSVQRVSIIPRGITGGHTRLMPEEDRQLWSRSQLIDAIAFMMGGIVRGGVGSGRGQQCVGGRSLGRRPR